MPIPFLIAPVVLSQPSSLLPQRIPLEGAWQLTQPERKIDIPAKVPGVVHLDLMRAGKIPDPFLGLNDKKVQWVGETTWTYSRSFQLTPQFLKNRKIILRCEGLDTLGRIEINGKEVARPDNFHRTWEFDVRPFVRSGANQIKIQFFPIEPFLKAHEVQKEFPGKPVQSHGWGYVRKPSFQMGWDFSPKLITAGIWRKIGILGWSSARLNDVEIIQDHQTKGQVKLEVKLGADVAAATSATVKVSYKGKPVTESRISLPAGKATAHLTIHKPNLWWPNGMGPQNMYDVKVELRDAKGQVVDRDSKRIGLRTVTWFDKTDHSPLGLAVNGRRFFAKGSNWVPADSLLVRTTPAQERELVQKAVDAHMNLLRLWGGGHYESDSLFDICDEKGLLVWFEFKYADATYPSFDPKWLANAKAEAEDNVRRVRHHPSVAVYSGNNEVIGFITEQTTPSSMSREDYNLLFHKTLREVVANLAPDAFYTPGSPEIGDDHYWDVWHGSASFASYRDRHGFMSEYGFQAFPVPRSIEQFTTAADRATVESPVMLNHQRNWRDGNALIVSTMRRYFRKPKDFESTLWLGQINQADGILTGVEHWRRDWPHSTASLVWQFNDPWPVVSWSMIDYYCRPKALYYRLKHAYAPVALSGLVKDQAVELWVANDRISALQGVLDWKLIDTEGEVVSKGSGPVEIPAGTSSRCISRLDFSNENTSHAILWANLRVEGEEPSETTVLFDRAKNLELADPEIRAEVRGEAGAYTVALESMRPALNAWVELKGLDAEYSDNFFTLIPGSKKSVAIKTRANLEEVRKALKVRSLFDTYAPGTEANPVVLAASDGSLHLTADDAEIVGDGAVLEVGTPSNIGNWQRVQDGLKWRVRGAKPGAYTVSAVVSIPNDEQGSTFDVWLQGKKVSGTVPGTGSWTSYTTIQLGTLQVSEGGEIVVELKPTKLVKGHVMNLRSVDFVPAKQAILAGGFATG